MQGLGAALLVVRNLMAVVATAATVFVLTGDVA